MNSTYGIWRAVVLVIAAAGLTGSALVESLIRNGYRNLAEDSFKSERSGHLVIARPGAFEHASLERERYLIGDAEAQRVRELAMKDDRVRAVTTRLALRGLISNGKISLPFLGEGVVPDHEALITTFGSLDPSAPKTVAIGSELAHHLGAEEGSPLILFSTSAAGVQEASDVRVASVWDTGLPLTNDKTVLMPIELARSLSGNLGSDRLVVFLHDHGDMRAAAASLSAELQASGIDLQVKTMLDLSLFYSRVKNLLSEVVRMLVLAILAVLLPAMAGAFPRRRLAVVLFFAVAAGVVSVIELDSKGFTMVTAHVLILAAFIWALGAAGARSSSHLVSRAAMFAALGVAVGVVAALIGAELVNKAGLTYEIPYLTRPRLIVLQLDVARVGALAIGTVGMAVIAALITGLSDGTGARRGSRWIAASAAAAFASLVLVGGSIAAGGRQLGEYAVRGDRLFHLSVTAPGFQRYGAIDLQKYILSGETLERAARVIEKDPDVQLVSSRLRVVGRIAAGKRSALVLGEGLVAADQRTLRKGLPVDPGPGLDPERPSGILISSALAAYLGLEAGSSAALYSATLDDMVNAIDVQLIAPFETGNPWTNDKTLILPLELAQSLYDTGGVQEVDVLLANGREPEAARARIAAALAENGLDLEVATWRELSLYFERARGLFVAIFAAFAGNVAIALLLGVALLSGAGSVIRAIARGCGAALMGGMIAAPITLAVVFLINGAGVEFWAPVVPRPMPLLIDVEAKVMIAFAVSTAAVASAGVLAGKLLPRGLDSRVASKNASRRAA